MLLFASCISFCVRKHLLQNDTDNFIYFFSLFVLWHSVLIFQSKLYTIRLYFSEVLNIPFWPETLCYTSKNGLLRSTEKSVVGKQEIRKLVCFANSVSVSSLLRAPVQNRHCQVAAEELICQAGALAVPWAWVGGSVHRPVTWSTALLQERKEYSLGQWNSISLQGVLVGTQEKAELYHSECFQWSTKCLHLSWSSHCRASPVGVGWLTVN